MNLYIIVVGVITVVILVDRLIRKHYSIWKDMGAPYEEPTIPYGNMKSVGKDDHFGGVLQKLYEKFKGSPFVGIYIFFKPTALIIDLELVKTILIQDFNYFHDRGVFYNEKDDPISAHMFAIDGAKWRLFRSKLSPTFTSGKMKVMFPIITVVSKRLEEKIGEISRQNGEDVDIKKLMMRFTTDVILNVAFGIECNSLHDENSEYHRMVMRVFSDPRHSFAFEMFLLSFRGLARKFGAKRFRDDVSEFFTRLFKSTVDYRVTNDVHRNDFMNLLIGLRQTDSDDKITFNELLAQAFVFFIAGFETTSSLLQSCFYELAANPDIQDKVRCHIEEILEKHNGELTYEAMMDMKYIDQVLYETLRLYPPVMDIFRETERDYKVPGTSFVFHKGTQIMIPAYAIQRDSKIYPNPDQFNPDNCSEENMKSRPSVTFLAFGDGPRACIGSRFGMLQARVALIASLRKYKYTLSHRMEKPMKLVKNSVVTSAEGGVWLNIEAMEKY